MKTRGKHAKMKKETIALLKQYYDEGASLDSIGLSLGMSKSSVCGALHRHYPDRKQRCYRVPEQSFEAFQAMLKDYGEGHSYAYLEQTYGIPPREVRRRLYAYAKLHPDHHAQLIAQREPLIAARRRAVMLKNNPRRKPTTWLAVSNQTVSNWSPLDDAIRTLQRFAPCYRSPCGKGIFYGTRLKTEGEIIALAERKAA